MRVAKVIEHHTLDQIDNLLKDYRTDAEVYVRLLYIRGIKSGIKSKVIAEVLNKSPQICSKWLNNYNERGLEGITSNRPKSGSKSKLDEEDLEKLRKILTQTGQYYTLEDARDIIYLLFNVKYSAKQTWVTVRKKLKLNYGKQFINYTEQPENHRAILKEKLEDIILDEVYLFLLDQSYFKNTTNVTRVIYDSDDDNVFVRTWAKFGTSVTGFMPINGKPLAETYERNNAFTTICSMIMLRLMHMESEEGKEILEEILNNPLLLRDYIKDEFKKENKTSKEKIEAIEKEFELHDGKKKPSITKIKEICNNKKITSARISTKQRTTIIDLLIESDIYEILNDEKPIVIVLDNAKIHKAADVAIACEILNIELIFLPTYSPDLNPIEDLWKIIKRVVYSSHYNNE